MVSKLTRLAFISAALLLLIGCGSPGDPLDYFYTTGQYPGEANTGELGNETLPWGIAVIETANIGVTYQDADYGAAWEGISLPDGRNGRLVIVWNTNTETGRIYAYAHGAWRYSDLN